LETDLRRTNYSRIGWTSPRPLLYLVVFAILLSLPIFLNEFLIHLMVLILLYAFLGMSWNILGGYAGQFSFGHAAFFGIGAYTSTLLFYHYQISPWIGMLVGALFAASFGLFIGVLCFRYKIKGIYFLFVTFAFAEILGLIVQNYREGFLRGSIGILIPLKGNSPLYFQFISKIPFYYIALCFLAVLFIINYEIDKRKMGFYLKAIKEDEIAAQVLGVNSFQWKLVAIVISSFFTAIGGTFYAQYISFIDPPLAFGWSLSLEIILRPILGGAGTILGPLIGSLVLTPLSEIAKTLFTGHSEIYLIFYGGILICCMIFFPKGIIGVAEQFLGTKES
jgi:branched-chain amino acid transport system permease protein